MAIKPTTLLEEAQSVRAMTLTPAQLTKPQPIKATPLKPAQPIQAMTLTTPQAIKTMTLTPAQPIQAMTLTPAQPIQVQKSTKTMARTKTKTMAKTMTKAKAISRPQDLRKSGIVQSEEENPVELYYKQQDQPFQAYNDQVLIGYDILDQATGEKIGSMEYAYDEEGNIVREVEIMPDLENMSDTIFKFVSEDNHQDPRVFYNEEYYKVPGGDWVLISSSTEKYDIAGNRLLDEITLMGEDGQYITITYVKTQYDDQDRPVVTYMYNNESNEGAPTDRIEYTYDGFMTIYDVYSIINGTETETEKYSIGINPSTGYTVRIRYAQTEEGWVPESKNESKGEQRNSGETIEYFYADYYSYMWDSEKNDWRLTYHYFQESDTQKIVEFDINYDSDSTYYGYKCVVEKCDDEYSQIGYAYHIETGMTDWEYSRKLYVYNKETENDRLYIDRNDRWNDGTWVPSDSSYTYQKHDGSESNISYCIWNEETQKWELSESSHIKMIKIGGDYYYTYQESANQDYGNREIADYDENANVIHSERYTYTQDAGWQPDFKGDYKYDTKGGIIYREEYQANLNEEGIFTGWYGRSLFDYKTDDQNRTLSLLNCSGWDEENNTWRYGNRQNYSYSDSISSTITETWISATQSWIPSNKIEYIYTPALTTRTQYSFSEGEWIAQYIEEEARVDGQITNRISYNVYFDTEQNAYVKQASEKSEWFVSDSTVILTSRYVSEGNWEAYQKVVYTDLPDSSYLYVKYSLDDNENWFAESKSISKQYSKDGNTYVEVTSSYWSKYDNEYIESYYLTGTDLYGNIIEGKQENRSQYVWWQKSFDANGNMTMYTTYSWNQYDECWYGDTKELWEYTEDGIQIANESYYYDSNDGIWKGQDKSRWLEDSLGNNILSEYYDWDDDLNEWYGLGKYEHAYDEEGNTIMTASYHWDRELKTWVGMYKEEDSKSADGTESYTNYTWDYESSSWLPTERSSSKYVSRPDKNIDYFLVKEEVYDKEASKWNALYDYKIIALYKSVVSVDPVAETTATITVADGQITVQADATSAIAIRTINGQAVASGAGTLSASVSAGIYLVTVADKTVKVLVK